MLRYAITGGLSQGETAAMRRQRLLTAAERWAGAGFAYVQLREKSLDAGELLELAEAMAAVFRDAGGQTKLLVNGRPDVAVAAGAAGVHLTAHPDELTPDQVRQVFALAGAGRPVVSVSCHTIAEVERVRDAGVDLMLFGPVFEKWENEEIVVAGVGIEMLAKACEAAQRVPVFALGGVTEENAAICLAQGAAGIAGIRTSNEWTYVQKHIQQSILGYAED